LLAAPRTQQRANLLFAAVQYLLRTQAPGHPLAGYYATLGGQRAADARLSRAFADFLAEFAGPLSRLCAGRTTQTNEARRAALLRPAFGLAARAGRPLALVELGTSAGLLLLPDRYGYRYVHGEREDRVGRSDPPEPLVMRCAVRGERWPDPVCVDPVISHRIGLDLDPLPPDDPDAAEWLRACVWPEHVERLARLDAALVEAAAVRLTLVRGDMVAELPASVRAIGPGSLPVVFSSNAVNYLSRSAQAELVHRLAELGGARDLTVVLNEAPRAGLAMFAADAATLAEIAVGHPVMVNWRDGRPTLYVLGQTSPHGEWLEWAPSEYAYRPRL
jgi:hypothetical protein